MQSSSPSDADTTHALTITRDGLPLFLLAAHYHPDADLRARLTARIETYLDSRRPFATPSETQRILERCHGARASPLDLTCAERALAGHVVRLVFARETRLHHKHRLLLGNPDDERDGVLLCAPCRVEPLERPLTGRLKRNRFHVRLDVGALRSRLTKFQHRPPLYRAFCRCDNGLTLAIRGPCRRAWSLCDASLASGFPLRTVGLTSDADGDGIRIRATTPEAILRLSALLMTGDLLRVRLGGTYLFVRLHDFDGDEAELPVTYFPGEIGESWLVGLPSVELSVPVEDILPLVQWAYPHEEWLVPELRERLVGGTPC